MNANEAAFEAAIEESLLTAGGYSTGEREHFDAGVGLDLFELLAFIETTQPKEWGELVARHGGDEKARATFARRLAKELDARGTVDVLRHGVVDLGITIRLAFFKPAHALTPELVTLYEANRVTVVRQLAYETTSTKALDMALFVNGIPTATAELKNQLTGQDIEHAKAQYRTDRDPSNVTLARRAVVHFAVDPETVAMTTRLDGPSTRFIPFNRGSGGAGGAGGAGNPPNPQGHRTAYLWEQVWQRDSWLDLLARFVHVTVPRQGSAADKRKGTRTVFPRFHQLDAVRKLESDARANGAGHQYLVQHSAGSGKSNTIAWLAHRLSNLHDSTDTKAFDKVIVITDRLILDRQLQDTIYQFEHAHGVVVKIDKNSQQLADALAGAQARIIITTLQKFPFVLEKVGTLPNRTYAVIIDEAHSSQTGDAAREMRSVLSVVPGSNGSVARLTAESRAGYKSGTEDDAELAAAESEDAHEEGQRGDGQDELERALRGRGHKENLSFFAFTATPKAKTLELFGTKRSGGAQERYAPTHLYSMKQAIEEGFILDVLANYTTYRRYFRLEKAVREDPNYDEARARRAIARFVDLHPHNLAQKAEIIVEHFRQHVRDRISGKAKAMVVTSSRLHAVRYKLAIDKYIAEKGYTDISALVAFSGKVIDEMGDLFTEPGMNHFPESETAERFGSDGYQVLVVAEKFQTGFDQPLLHTMYVDKVLTGLNAVQTLSRLNRMADGKDDTFVLDFRNTVDDIQKAFEPWYETTVATPTDPNLLYDAKQALRQFDVIREVEIDAVVKSLAASKGSAEHGAVYAALDPALDRFVALDEDGRADFRDKLTRFIHVYSFLSQVVTFTDEDLERYWTYSKALDACLPGQASERLDLGSEVQLSHLRIEQTFTGSAALPAGGGELSAIFDGRGKQYDPDEAPLSEIIIVINDRYGLNLGESDRLLLEQFKSAMVSDPDLGEQARANTLDQFRQVFEKRFMTDIVTRMDDNEAIFKKILDDREFHDLLFDVYVHDVYKTLREGVA